MRTGREAVGRIGIWSRELRFQPDRAAVREAAAELDELGYEALWIPDVGGDVLDVAAELLDSTRAINVATGIINIWMHDPDKVAAGVAALESGDRFLTGLGVSHPSIVNAEVPDRYAKPLTVMGDYLDRLDTADPPLPASDRVLAALGPKMLELSRDRAGGAHPYLVPPEHTARARAILGPGKLLAPEQGVYLSADADEAFEVARESLGMYLAMPNYIANFRRLGFDDADFVDGGSRNLINSVIAFGDEQVIADRIAAHFDAGADHVCIQVLGQADDDLPLGQWRRLAPILKSL